MLDRLDDLSAVSQGNAEVVMGLNEVGLDFQGLPIVSNGLFDLSAAGQGEA